MDTAQPTKEGIARNFSIGTGAKFDGELAFGLVLSSNSQVHLRQGTACSRQHLDGVRHRNLQTRLLKVWKLRIDCIGQAIPQRLLACLAQTASVQYSIHNCHPQVASW